MSMLRTWTMMLAICAFAGAAAIAAEPVETTLISQSATVDKQDNLHLDASAEINAPPQKVFEALSKPDALARYDSMVTSAKIISQSGNTEVVQFNGQTVPAPNSPGYLQVKFQFDPSHNTIASESVGSPLQFKSRYELKPANGGKSTTVHFTSVSNNPAKAMGLDAPVEMRKQVALQTFMTQLHDVTRYIDKGGK